MKLFKLKMLFDEENQISDKFVLELLFCNQEKELEDYWLVEGGYMLSEILIDFLNEWKKAVLNLRNYEKVFLSIGIWDEYVEGFFIEQLDNATIKIVYGSILNWSGFTSQACMYNIDENAFYKEFETGTVKCNFLKDIEENIFYLSM